MFRRSGRAAVEAAETAEVPSYSDARTEVMQAVRNLGLLCGRHPGDAGSYFSRAGAKALVKRIKSEGDKGIRTYYCDECEHWHAGHLPDVVRRGDYTAAEIYGRPAS